MPTRYQCEDQECKKIVPPNEITEVRIEQTRVPIFQVLLCDECYEEFIHDMEQRFGVQVLTEEDARRIDHDETIS